MVMREQLFQYKILVFLYSQRQLHTLIQTVCFPDDRKRRFSELINESEHGILEKQCIRREIKGSGRMVI